VPKYHSDVEDTNVKLHTFYISVLNKNAYKLSDIFSSYFITVASRQRTVSNFLFTREFFTKNNITVVHTHPTRLTWPPATFLIPQLKIKLKGRHFDTAEIKAESQVVLYTLTENDFQDAFKKWQKRWKQSISAEADYVEGNGGQ
jgi:hypothetical protein